MTDLAVINIVTQAIVLLVLLSAPTVLIALLVGFIAALLQTVTSIQEQTLSMVPKTLAIFATLVVTGPWMLSMLVGFVNRLFTGIPGLLGIH